MAGPFANHFYHERVIRYSRFLGSILSDLKIDTEGKLVRLPLEYLGGIRDQSSAVYSAGVLPKMTLRFIGLEVNSEKVLNGNRKQTYGSQVQDQRLPVFLDFEWCIRTKKQNDLFQVQEQVLMAMYPTFDIKVMSGDDTQVVENLKIYLTSYDFVDSFEGTGEEPNNYDLTFMVRIEGGWFYGRSLNDTTDPAAYIIKEVDINISTDYDKPFSDERPWFNIYEPTTVIIRFNSDLPLADEQGAYVFDKTTEAFEVIGSGEWIRNGYES